LPPPATLLLSSQAVEYLRTQLDAGIPERTKRALQELCLVYRRGQCITAEQLLGVEQTIVGILHTPQAQDEKVRRWALNALARLGRGKICLEAVITTLSRYDDPQTVASGIAAIYRLSTNPTVTLGTLKGFDPKTMMLGALQHVPHDQLDLSHLPIRIDTAEVDHLKLSLVVIGLDRAPDHLFDPRHENAAIVKELGRHDDNVVSQYTVWAITENAKLGIRDLGIPLKDIEQQPANVRGWMYQLIGMSSHDAQQNWELVGLGAGDDAQAARFGLAVGLKETFFASLEALVIDWLFKEPDMEVRLALTDHVVRQYAQHLRYEQAALELYEKAPPRSDVRRRMEAVAAGTGLYSQFRTISFDGTADLFRGATIMKNETNNTFNIGTVQAGAAAFGGNARSEGSVSNLNDVEIQNEISKIIELLHSSVLLPGAEKKELLASATAAQADPSKDKVGRLWELLRKVSIGGSLAASAGNLAMLAHKFGLF